MEFTELLNVEFTAYVALAFLLYVIREATRVSNRYIPVIAVVLGVGFSAFEAGTFTYDVFMNGLQYALLGVGTVASIKYAKDRGNQE